MKRTFALILIFASLLTFASCKLPDVFTTNAPPKFKQIEVQEAQVEKRSFYYEFVQNNYPAYLENIKTSFHKNADKCNEIFKIINSYRDEKQVSYLIYDEELSILASIRAQEIAETKKYEHNRPYDKGYFSTLFNEYGYLEGKAAENIAWDFLTAEDACIAWKNSKSHYKNLLDKTYTKTGIGIAQTAEGDYIYVQEFMN